LRDLYSRLPRTGTSRPGVETDLCEELFGLYAQGHRHYHTLRHVEECLHEFDGVFAYCADPAAVEMALWYHDIVYETASSVNERLSANKAIFDCARLGVESNAFQALVSDLVLATKHVASVSGSY
jgi:predicted metal-dependent HD superfamily phosphohydrolase